MKKRELDRLISLMVCWLWIALPGSCFAESDAEGGVVIPPPPQVVAEAPDTTSADEWVRWIDKEAYVRGEYVTYQYEEQATRLDKWGDPRDYEFTCRQRYLYDDEWHEFQNGCYAPDDRNTGSVGRFLAEHTSIGATLGIRIYPENVEPGEMVNINCQSNIKDEYTQTLRLEIEKEDGKFKGKYERYGFGMHLWELELTEGTYQLKASVTMTNGAVIEYPEEGWISLEIGAASNATTLPPPTVTTGSGASNDELPQEAVDVPNDYSNSPQVSPIEETDEARDEPPLTTEDPFSYPTDEEDVLVPEFPETICEPLPDGPVWLTPVGFEIKGAAPVQFSYQTLPFGLELVSIALEIQFVCFQELVDIYTAILTPEGTLLFTAHDGIVTEGFEPLLAGESDGISLNATIPAASTGFYTVFWVVAPTNGGHLMEIDWQGPLILGFYSVLID